jgi:hypothetical protein
MSRVAEYTMLHVKNVLEGSMETTRSRLCSVAATVISVLLLVALAVTQLHLIVANVLLARDRHKRCTRPVRCSPCV